MTFIKFFKQGHVATITLNDPNQLNAMTMAMGAEFQALVGKIKKDKDVRVVILTGTGRAFSSGGNLKMLEEKIGKPKQKIEKEMKAFYQVYLSIRDLPQPVIAAIHGHAVGAGLCLALACDLRYASATAKLGVNFAKLGLAPGMGGHFLFTQLVGPVFASEILLTGKLYTAEQMQKFGVLNEVFSENSLSSEVQKIADDIAANGPLALQFIKKGIQMSAHKTLRQMLDFEAKSQAMCFKSKDIYEGIRAVKEKRAPKFTGK